MPSQATLLWPLLHWLRYVPPRTASHQQLAAMALVGSRRQLATMAFVGPRRQLTATALVGPHRCSCHCGSHQQLATTDHGLSLTTRRCRCLDPRRQCLRPSLSACNGPDRSFSLHGRVATLLPYACYKDMPLTAHISASNVASILQGTQSSVVHTFDK